MDVHLSPAVAETVLEWLAADGWKIDAIAPDGTHRYWSTHCRHDEDGGHENCDATELAPGAPRRPAQCKTCAAPCRCPHHAMPLSR